MFHGRLTPALKRGLDVLDDRLVAAKIPPSKLDETLTVATWNIREFGKRARHPASLHYIAEIIGRFDLVSIVELRDKVDELETVMIGSGGRETWSGATGSPPEVSAPRPKSSARDGSRIPRSHVLTNGSELGDAEEWTGSFVFFSD